VIGVGVRRIFLARAVVDMRRSFDTLAGMVRDQLGSDPLSGDAFVFVGRDRRRLKVLLWDRDGFWVCAKRLARGYFALPDPALERTSSLTVVLDRLVTMRIWTPASDRRRSAGAAPGIGAMVSNRRR